MRTDARVRYTKRALREALLGCMRKKPIQAVTVKEVCEAAGINRTTFYAHYRDCFDLLEQIENEMLEDYRDSLCRTEALDAGAVTFAILNMMESNRDLCDLLICNYADNALIRKMTSLAHELCIEKWKRAMPKASPEEVELLFSCMTAGLLHVIVDYSGRIDRERIVEFVSTTVKSCAAPYLHGSDRAGGSPP